MASRAKKTSFFAAAGAPKDQPTLANRRNEKLTTGFYLFLAFFIPFIFMFVTFALAQVSPFGKNQILATDLWHQYYPFLVDFHSKLQEGGSLLWTWKSGGGTNYLALMAYYTASPLNLLSVFFPASLLREFVYVATCVKIGLAGLFFALFLRITFKRRDVTITAFGIMYALCAFIMGYYWNIIWLDTIALLPLVIAGTVALLREGRFRLYIVTLVLSLLSNYYIALFTCIFVALISVGYTIVEWKGWRKTLRDFLKMAGCTIVSFMISAVLILPVYFALGTTHSSNNVFPERFSVNMGGTPDFAGVLSGIGKTISNTIAFVKPTPKEGLPNVYCGVFVIFLAILYLFCSGIKKRERFYCLGLLLFFMLSFVIRPLDFIWHGFHFPNMLPHRFSFLFSFVVIYMAFRVFTNLDSLRPVSVIAATCSFFVYLGIAYRYYHDNGSTLSALFTSADGSNPDPVLLSGFLGLLMASWVTLYVFRFHLNRLLQAILSSVIGVASTVFIVLNANTFMAPLRNEANAGQNNTGFIVAVVVVMTIAIAVIAVALYSKQYNKDFRALRTMLSVILIVLALAEGLFSAASGVKTVSVTDGSWYPLGTTNTLSMVDTVKEREQDTVDVYRTELTRYYTLNDPTLIGTNGMSMFSSMANSTITEYLEKFGICGWVSSNRYTYQESSPFTNLMLNIKYLISPYNTRKDWYRDTTHLDFITSSESTALMQNKYYLPMGFMVSDNLLRYDLSTLSSTDPIANQNYFFRLATGLEGDLYSEIDTTSPSSSQVQAIAPYDGVAVAYCTANQREAYDVTINRTYVTDSSTGDTATMTEKANIQRPYIMMVGTVKAGDTLMISSGSGTINGTFYMFNESQFQKAYQLFARSTLQATEVTGNSLSGTITVEQDGLFYTSIPAISGWTATVDGEKTEITPVGGAMIAFSLSRGTHTIELKFTPQGFIPGLILAVLGVLIFIAMILLSWKKINLIDRFILRAGTSSGGRAAAASAQADVPAEPAPTAEPVEQVEPTEDPDPDETSPDPDDRQLEADL